MDVVHIPVLLEETLHYLIGNPEGIYLDCTLGTGGHFQALAQRLAPGAVLVGFDADHQAIEYCRTHLEIPQKYLLINANFAEVKKYCFRNGIQRIDGVLMDLGLSSFALDDPDRGFSFQNDGPLDMRFSPGTSPSAEEFINETSVQELRRVFWEYGEERKSGAIARAINEARQKARIRSTGELARIVTRSAHSRFANKTLSRIFQSVRIAINNELGVLEAALRDILEMLNPDSSVVAISYHSLEDRIVKQFFRRESTGCICPPEFPVCQCNHKARLIELTRTPVVAGDEEIKSNSRARSAKLRSARRTAEI